MELTMTMAMGLFSLAACVLAWALFSRRRVRVSLLLSVDGIAFAVVAAYFWRAALAASGKDTALLGFRAYPAAGKLSARAIA